MIYLYADGSSTGKSGKEWGWGFVAVDENDKVIHFDAGGGSNGTNQVAELEAAIFALIWANFHIHNKDYIGDKKLTLISDSQYMLHLADGRWTAQKNEKLVKDLQSLYSILKPELKWVKGHAGNKFNEMADFLAKQGKEANKK